MRKDHVDHVLVSFFMALSGAFLFGVSWGLGTAFVVGAVKELWWDWWLGRGSPEWSDMAANVAGIGLAWVLLVWRGI